MDAQPRQERLVIPNRQINTMQPSVRMPWIEGFAVLVEEVAGEGEVVVFELLQLITQASHQCPFVIKPRCAIQACLVGTHGGLLVGVVEQLRAKVCASLGSHKIV